MSKKKFLNLFYKFNKAKILCIGDLILDTFVQGNVDRISPEAPVPILLSQEINNKVGGAGNVARNISSLGGKVGLLSLIGNDINSQKVSSLLKKTKKIKPLLIKNHKYKLPNKIRYSNKSSQLLRVDIEEQNQKINLDNEIIKKFLKEVKNYTTVVISNYNKGTLSKKSIKKIINYCNKENIIILIDPKNKDFSIYQNANIITPNLKELSDAAGNRINNERKLDQVAEEIRQKYNFDHILVTKSEKGMKLFSKSKVTNYPTAAKDVYDVTGAGDTVISLIALGFSTGLKISDSVKLANYAAGIVVGKKGTAVTNINELKNKLK